MSFFDAPNTTYTFRLKIERNDQTILETAIVKKADAAELAKAKKTIQRLLNEYTPAIQPPKAAQAPELAQNSPAPAPAVEQQPEDLAEFATSPRAHGRPSQGAKGMLRLRCKECGNTFGTFLREYQPAVLCKCGRSIDLTAPLATYHFTCPYCECERFGKTNLEDPEITVRCKCGGDIDLRWNPRAIEYQN